MLKHVKKRTSPELQTNELSNLLTLQITAAKQLLTEAVNKPHESICE